MQNICTYLKNFRGGGVPLLNTQAKGLNGTIRGGQYEYSGSSDELSGRSSRYWNSSAPYSKQGGVSKYRHNNSICYNSGRSMACSIKHGSQCKCIRHIQSCFRWNGGSKPGNKWWRKLQLQSDNKDNRRNSSCKGIYRNCLYYARAFVGDKISTCFLSNMLFERGCA